MSEACSQRELPQRLKVQRQTKGSLNYKCYKNNSPDWSQIPSKTSRWLTRTKASAAWKCVNPELTERKCWQMDGHHGGALGGWCFETQFPLNDFVLEKWFITAESWRAWAEVVEQLLTLCQAGCELAESRLRAAALWDRPQQSWRAGTSYGNWKCAYLRNWNKKFIELLTWKLTKDIPRY